MNRVAFVTISSLLVFASPAFAQGTPTTTEVQTADVATSEYLDVLYTNDGSVWKGVIVEQVPGVSYRLALSGGSVIVIDSKTVNRVTKETNPGYQSSTPRTNVPTIAPGTPTAPAPLVLGDPAYVAPAESAPDEGTAVSASASLPAPMVTTGLRTELGIGFAFPNSDWAKGELIQNSFLGSLRAGKELMFGNIGITPAARFNFIYWSFDDQLAAAGNLMHLHFGGELRAALHAARFAPYLGVGMGLDVNVYDPEGFDIGNGVGFGLNLMAGLDIITLDNLAVGAGLSIHPGFTESSEDDGAVNTTYTGFTLNLNYLGL